jgi:prepilin-type N-terminal cleavage/methylation domain-containing protein
MVSTTNKDKLNYLVPIPLKMRRYLRHSLHSDKGFTLLELLVVVAIIAILAAAVTTSVVAFVSSGDVGAARAETKTLQIAVDGMMSDSESTSISAVTGWDASPDVVTVTSGGMTYDAADYFRREITPDSTWDVAISGRVICTKFGGNVDADFLAKVNQ